MRCFAFTLFALALALPLLVAGPAKAELEGCRTSIEGKTIRLKYDPEDERVTGNTSFRERMFGGRGEISCPAFVTLRYLTPELDDAERGPFCLRYDREAETYTGYDLGERGAFLGCKAAGKTFCQRVNDSKDAAVTLAQRGMGAAEDAAGTVSALKHGSGAVILSGPGGQVATFLGSLGTTAMTVLTSPATLTAAAVSVVTVGGAVYVCS